MNRFQLLSVVDVVGIAFCTNSYQKLRHFQLQNLRHTTPFCKKPANKTKLGIKLFEPAKQKTRDYGNKHDTTI